jgi:CRP/FNR family transcriptional regulator, cyclic AMP receptor protein
MVMTVGRELRTIWADLLEGVVQPTSLPAGDLILRSGDVPTIALIRAGIVRVFIVAPARDATHPNHQFTVRYARSGDLIGLVPLLSGSRKWSAEAVVQTTLFVLTIEQVRAAAANHPELPWLLTEHIATWASDAIETIALSGSRSTGASIARHLHEMALTTPKGQLMACVSQQRLADAAGTAREVVTRELSLLRAHGVIATKPGRIEILDEARLQRAATGDALAAATDAPASW